MKAIKHFFIKLFVFVGLSSISSDRHIYRVDGFYFRYRYNDGTLSDPILCHWIFANCIGGYSVCGWYPMIEEIGSISISFRKARRFFFLENLKRLFIHSKHFKQHWSIYRQYQLAWRYLWLPKGLSQDQVRDIFFEQSLKNLKL